MPSPAEMGFRQPRPEKPDNWKNKEYNQENFGHEAEKIFIEALRKHPYVEKIERDDYSDEREETDFYITFKGSKEPIRVQFSLKEKIDLPLDIVFVKGENRIFNDAKERYKKRKEEDPNITLSDCIAKQDLNELIGRIFDKLTPNRRKNILARLSAIS
ncbi:hypothetical protein D4R86_06115 [bacterium]|nr:MAG: hypothetical protein D4R86_06115 [bacterium]